MDYYRKSSKFINGIYSYDDANKFVSQITTIIPDPIEVELVNSLLDKHDFKKLSFNKIVNLIKNSSRDTICYTGDNLIYLSVLTRYLTRNIPTVHTQNLTNIKCPHCGNDYIITKGCSYVICGYTGYNDDITGCGRDWCMDCGKKLCKEWKKNKLYIPENRKHDTMCCIKYAIENSIDFEEQFCKCVNPHVER